jgi:ABC-type Mn2+/Zn2+ transport system permease subunit
MQPHILTIGTVISLNILFKTFRPQWYVTCDLTFRKFCTVPTHCIYVFLMILGIN